MNTIKGIENPDCKNWMTIKINIYKVKNYLNNYHVKLLWTTCELLAVWPSEWKHRTPILLSHNEFEPNWTSSLKTFFLSLITSNFSQACTSKEILSAALRKAVFKKFTVKIIHSFTSMYHAVAKHFKCSKTPSTVQSKGNFYPSSF